MRKIATDIHASPFIIATVKWQNEFEVHFLGLYSVLSINVILSNICILMNVC